ncbi:MAG: hypothetical protein CL843_13990 [Crocinitomicaceae bacterium]|nr:hypothetical protein [Crocinitomicaceae bacterium]
MKYRRLTNEELQQVEKEFITFLAANSVTADDWKKLNKQEPSKAEMLVEIFSDIVIEKALNKCDCLEKVSPFEFRAYKFFENFVKLIVVKIEPNEKINLTQGELGKNIQLALTQTPDNVEFFHAKKEYKKLREQEMFEVLQSGAYMTNDSLFSQLNRLIA